MSKSKRADTGAGFEAELSLIHRAYEFQRAGRLRKQHVPFKFIKGQWQPVGAAGVDFVGHVVLRDFEAHVSGVSIRRLETCRRLYPSAHVYPVAFDAKVLGREHATYHHEKKMQHQLHALRDEAATGVYAFLLIYAPQIERVFMLPIENHFEALLTRGVKLWERHARLNGPDALDVNPLAPSMARPTDGAFPGLWDWAPLLQWCPGLHD